MKRTQRGAIGIGGAVGLGLIGLLVVTIIWAVGIRNNFVKLENGIVAANESRQTTLSNISQKVKETIGIRALSVDDIKATVNEQIHSRNDGKNPLVVMLKENNVAPSPELYTKIMNIIDSGRTEFLKSEKMLVDRKRNACDITRNFPHGPILSFFGLPTLHTGCNGDTDDFKVLLNDKSAESFKTGTDGGLY
jgi:hypothetical protein